MKELTHIIKEPVISEHSTKLSETGKYVFIVNPTANKLEIKHAVEKLFNVKVDKVNTIQVLGKQRRMRYKIGKKSDWKKAIVTLVKGDKIEFI